MRSILYILFLLVSMSANAQAVIQFTSNMGLSSSRVRNIYEDSRKNVWIATRNGLNRWDGAKNNVYHHDDANPSSLSHDLVTAVYELDHNNVLVGTEVGLQSFSYATNSFTDIPLIRAEGDTIHVHVVSMAKFLDGKLHVCVTSDGHYVIEKDKQGHIVALQSKEYYWNELRPIQMLNSKSDEVWVVNRMQQVVRYKGKKAQLMQGVEGANHVCMGHDGTIYVSTDRNGVYRYDQTSQSFRKIVANGLPENTVIKSIRPGADGRLMICTDGNGLKIYDERTGAVAQTDIRTSNFTLANSNVEDAVQDSDGNLWVAVYWKGVMVVPRLSSTFEYVGSNSPLTNTIGTSCVMSILPSRNGGTWVATDNDGLYYVSADGTQSTHWSPTTNPEVPATVASMHEDDKGNLWLASPIGGLTRMNIASGTFTPFSAIHPEGDKVQKLYDIFADDQHRLWIASMGNGLYCYNLNTNELNRFSDTNGFVEMPNPWVSCVCVSGNKLYLGTSGGLYTFVINQKGLQSRVIGSLTGVTVNSLRPDKRGTVWVGTSKGVYSFEDGKEKQHYSVADGLPDNNVCAVELVETNGVLTVWASTDNGLCRIDTQTDVINCFFYSDGLQSNEFNNNVSAQRNGTLYFGGINGLNYFNPKKIESSSAGKKLDFRIVDFYLQGSPVHVGDRSGWYDILTEWISEAKEVHLSHDDNNFSLELSTMSFSRSHTSYQYSINNGEWINLGESQNRITFTNMAAGTYRIRIRANGYNQQSLVKSILIVVHPAWYASPLAYIIYLLLLLVAGYFIYQQVQERIAARRILQTHRQQEELNEARIQFFMNISHEIRTPMTLILAPLEKLRAMDSDEEHQRNYNLIHQNAHRILRLINQLMDVRKIEKGQFKLSYAQVDIVAYLQSVMTVFEASAQRRDIEFLFIHHGIERLDAMVDSDSFDKIVMNLLSNAFKFTPDGGYIHVTLTRNGDNFNVSVADTGVGIPDAEKKKVFERFYSAKHQNGYIGTGIGLNLTALLVDLHGGTIDVKDNPDGQGSVFETCLPLEPYDSKGSSDKTSALEVISDEGLTPSVDAGEQLAALPIEKNTERHHNLLVVEDDVAIRQYIHSELSSDFTIHECSNGLEAWELVVKNPEKVDLIISDIMMPVMEGTSLCQRVKENFNTNHIPVILMSAKITEADRIAGISIGADAYVTKPFNVELLRTTAVNLLRQRQMLLGKFSTAAKSEGQIDKVQLTSPDEHLMARVLKVINENLDNPDINVELVADKVGVSRVHFHRKIKELTGQTPRDFIKTIRLKEAARLLSEKHLDITDVSVATGFKSLSTFSTSFKQLFGQSPTEYMKEKNKL